MGRGMTAQNAPSSKESEPLGPHFIHSSLRVEPLRVHIPYGITIGLSVFAGLPLFRDIQRDRHTNQPRYVCNNRPHRIQCTAMRVNNNLGVSRKQKGKTSLDLNEARDGGVWGWQWHQLDHMQTICTSLQTDNHTNTSSSLNFYRPHALPDAQSTASK